MTAVDSAYRLQYGMFMSYGCGEQTSVLVTYGGVVTITQPRQLAPQTF